MDSVIVAAIPLLVRVLRFHAPSAPGVPVASFKVGSRGGISQTLPMSVYHPLTAPRANFRLLRHALAYPLTDCPLTPCTASRHIITIPLPLAHLYGTNPSRPHQHHRTGQLCEASFSLSVQHYIDNDAAPEEQHANLRCICQMAESLTASHDLRTASSLAPDRWLSYYKEASSYSILWQRLSGKTASDYYLTANLSLFYQPAPLSVLSDVANRLRELS